VRTLQDQLCLNRPNFQINPKQSFEDAQLFFGGELNNQLAKNIETGYMAGYVPRIYLFGSYGTGKTHVLYNLKHHFDRVEEPIKVLPIIVQLEAESKTRYQSLHKRLLDAIGIDEVEKSYRLFGHENGTEYERAYAELFPDANLRKAMQLLSTGPEITLSAWRWLTGERMTPKDQGNTGITSTAAETGDLVEILVAIGELFKRTRRHLLFLIDEGEALHNVTSGDPQRSWHDAFRRLADSNDNQSVGFILAIYQTGHNDPPEFIMEGDITTRLGKPGIITLEPSAPAEVRAFLSDLVEAFVDREAAQKAITEDGLDSRVGLYPFTEDGLDAFVEQAATAPEHAIPRTIIRALTACALEALTSNKRAFDSPLVEKVVPQEFAEQA
jgi:hypothetical protein